MYEMILNGGKSIEEQAAHGYVVVSFKPHGFWTEVITVRFKRDWSLLETERSNWYYELTWSSGGRDHKVVADDVEATNNFIAALEEAQALIGEHFIPEKLEAAYQVEVERKKEIALAAAAERAARVAADPEIGEADAKKIILSLEKAAREHTDTSCVYSFRHRGADTLGLVSAMYNTRTASRPTLTFYINAQRVAKEEAIRRLATKTEA